MNTKKNRVGEKHITNEGYEIEIIEYFGAKNCTILFKAGNILKSVEYGVIKKGSIKNPFHKSVYGIGYVGQGNYKIKTDGKTTKTYNTWHKILERCYSEKSHIKNPSYKNCYVDNSWHNFQVFAKWFVENYREYMLTWQIDKDILVKWNKIYGPETCCFVPQEINSCFIKQESNRGNLPIGVSKHPSNNTYSVGLTAINKKRVTVYGIKTPEEAFVYYKNIKEKIIMDLADKWKDKIFQIVYEAMVNYQVEITD